MAAYGSAISGREYHEEVARTNERRIASFLINKNMTTFDEEVYILAEQYVQRHKVLRKSLLKLEEKQQADVWLQRPDVTVVERIRFIFENPFATGVGKAVFVTTSLLVLLSIIVLVLRSVPKFNPVIRPEFTQTWRWIEGGVTFYFTIELIVRFLTSKDKVTFLKDLTVVAEVIALLPFYVDLISGEDIGALQILRLVRLVKLFRQFATVNDLFSAVNGAAKVLLAPLVFLVGGILVSSTLVYYAERGKFDPTKNSFMIADCECEGTTQYTLGVRACDKVPSRFQSILHTMWWGVVTLTTVGYGDLVPQCTFGKLVASISMVFGVVFMAMPIAIVGSNFTAQLEKRRQHELSIRIEAAKERQRRQAEATDRVRSEIGDADAELIQSGIEGGGSSTPAVRFVRFLRDRMEASTIALDQPPPYLMMLIDFYLSTRATTVNSAPTAVTYELERIGKREGPGSANDSSFSPSPKGDSKRITLNRYVDLLVGSASADFTDPDIVIPAALTNSVGARISQRHAVISVPPQFCDLPLLLRPLRGACLWVNGQPVPPQGLALQAGDQINFGDPSHPLMFRLRAVHPFALDI